MPASRFALVIWRLPLLRTRDELDSLVSREAAFLFNNLLLVALMSDMLCGDVFPIVSRGRQRRAFTVGPPYFNFFLRAFGLTLLFLMGLGPLLAWRRSSIRDTREQFLWPGVAALVAGGVLFVLGAGVGVAGVVAFTFSAFVLATIVRSSGAAAACAQDTRRATWLGASSGSSARNRRRYGGYIVHAAIVLLAIGIAGGAYGATRVQH